ncbi:S26 family signal peptidase [Streptomyces sp. NBC_00525]|uniref:S26 family signal peptidase n=1 Tax=Streptomyces sp. NBC_00525 TaxID=2903660 RepID=UPI002E80D651|nr:S26 family signal peptidase [Streptomyces sp. NBC_00525]WUC96135.1 S26 family signal peptidase [Streptomyces sp. NBC_00525]
MVAVLGAGAGLVALLVLLRLTVSVLLVSGPSMTPALRHGQRVLFVRRGLVRPRAGRIVVLRPPPGPAGRPLLVKRVVALGGDPVPPEVREATGAAPDAVVPPGRLMVLGDNPPFSTDSRLWGALPVSDVVGVVLEGTRLRGRG